MLEKLNKLMVLTENQKEFLEKYSTNRWKLSDGKVNIEGNFDCKNMSLNSFNNIQFGEDTMKKYDEDKKNDIENEVGFKKPLTEWLGFYQHSSLILGIHKPVIALCPERIIECVNNNEELMFLIAKVLIHEFAHAKLALHPNAQYDGHKPEFYKFMEEPMANLITLMYFDNYNKRTFSYNNSTLPAHKTNLLNPFDYVKDFVQSQPTEYQMAWNFFNHQLFDAWWIWRNNKIKFLDSNSNLKEIWLKYVRSEKLKTDKEVLIKNFNAFYKY
jgi:hypothetical protein